jgi:hypothetical protein
MELTQSEPCLLSQIQASSSPQLFQSGVACHVPSTNGLRSRRQVARQTRPRLFFYQWRCYKFFRLFLEES